jgi:hypothetical protein
MADLCRDRSRGTASRRPVEDARSPLDELSSDPPRATLVSAAAGSPEGASHARLAGPPAGSDAWAAHLVCSTCSEMRWDPAACNAASTSAMKL